MSTILTREDFLAKSKSLKLELVEVPDLGGSVYLRELSTGQRLEYRERIVQLQAINPQIGPANSLEIMALMISFSACDETGVPLFKEEDVKALADNSPNALMELSIKVMELSGISGKAIEEVAANLKKVQSSSSATDLPTNSKKRSRRSKNSPLPSS